MSEDAAAPASAPQTGSDEGRPRSLRARIGRLFADPYVAVISYDDNTIWPGVTLAAREAAGRPAKIFVRLSWATTRFTMQRMVRDLRAAKARHPNLTLTVMTETDRAAEAYRRIGVDAFQANPNAFVDERPFAPDPEAPKDFDAVYTARFAPFKRHDLAAQVEQLALISAADYDDLESAAAILRALPGVSYCNLDPETGELWFLGRRGVADVLNRSRCGLALSAEEGGMRASIEYLYCGLPVVSTASKGGRALFFSPHFVEIVEAEPTAVAKGVERFRTDPPDPRMVRERTLERVLRIRARFLERLSKVIEADAFALADSRLWLPQFRGSLVEWEEHPAQ